MTIVIKSTSQYIYINMAGFLRGFNDITFFGHGELAAIYTGKLS